MRRLFGILVVVLVCLCAAFGAAEEEWTPPEGKERGELDLFGNDEEFAMIYNQTGLRDMPCRTIYPEGRRFDSDAAESVIRGNLTFLSGDAACRELLTRYEPDEEDKALQSDTDEGVLIRFHGDKALDGDPILHGRFRLETESEHYYTMSELDITFVPVSEVSVTLGFDRIRVPVGREKVMKAFIDSDEIITHPEGIYYSCGIGDANGERFVETEEYKLRNPYIEVLKPGEYQMTLYVLAGENGYEIPFPVTVEGMDADAYDAMAAEREAAKAGEAGAEESGAADAEAGAEPVKVGETVEEIPGTGNASVEGLTLALDNGDREFDVYAGSGRVHLAFWDIVDYEKLKNAWGGEPGWSVMPAEGSPDAVRWSNSGTDGKSLWAFHGDAVRVSEPGDYASILTVTWHGQSASAKITLHVSDPPNGPLEGISGVEESYTVTIGEEIRLNVRPLPDGWSLPGESADVRVSDYRSVLEDYAFGDPGGLPYFLTTNDGSGNIRLKALRSGVYTVDVEYSCGTFSESTTATINVLNEDGTLPATAAEITETGESAFSYDLETDPATGAVCAVITGGNAGKNLVIPELLDGYPVRKIGDNAFEARTPVSPAKALETVEISEGVEQIGNSAFEGCENLRSVKLPESLTKIGYLAFAGCGNLTEIRMPSGITLEGIGSNAFDAIGAEDVVLADGTSLRGESLKGDTKWFSHAGGGWKFIRLEDGTVRITGLVDHGSISEETVIPETLDGLPVSELGESLFRGNSILRKVTLPESLRVIGANAFCECENLTEVNLPEGLLEAGRYAFADVAAEGLALPEGAVENSDPLWYVGALRFDASGEWEYGILADGTALLTSLPYVSRLVIPATVDGIPVSAVTGLSPRGWRSPEGAEAVKEIVLPEGLTVIGDQAFSNCSSLKGISLPESLRVIGKEAFIYVPLTRLALPEGLETIGVNAFHGNELKEIDIPAGVRAVGDKAFIPGNGKALRKVTFRGPRTEIGAGVFGYSYRPDAPDPNVPEGWIDRYAEEDPDSAPPQALTIACFPGSTADRKYQVYVTKEYLSWGAEYILTAPADRVLRAGLCGEDEIFYEVIVPEGVEEIAEGAFAGMQTLCRVSLPSTLTAVGPRAFEGCAALKELNLPAGVSSLGEAAFRDCPMLEKVSLPAAVTEIPDALFENCAALKELKVGAKALASIGNKAFAGCGSLAKFDLKAGLTAIGEEAFYGTALTKAQIPDTVTTLGKGAFALSAITSVSFPKGMEDIPERVCYGALSLKTVRLPASVKTIGDFAFAYCLPTALNLPEGLTSIGAGAFCYDASYVQSVYAGSGGKKAATALKTLKLPASLRTIGANAFACNDALTSVTFAKGSSLQEIGGDAFAMCVRLKEIRLPDSVEAVGANAFTNCIGLVKADLGRGLVRLGAEAFMYDTALKSLTVPDTATELGEKILEGCGASLTVHCGEGSTMETYVRTNAPDVKTAR